MPPPIIPPRRRQDTQGIRIRHYMQKRGVGLSELARHMGWQRQNLNNVLNDMWRPSDESLQKMAEYLDTEFKLLKCYSREERLEYHYKFTRELREEQERERRIKQRRNKELLGYLDQLNERQANEALLLADELIQLPDVSEDPMEGFLDEGRALLY
jgi:transcriptional regulator with XRE-family HTH domain